MDIRGFVMVPALLDKIERKRGVVQEEVLIIWGNKPCYFSPSELATVLKGRYIAGHTSLIKRSALLEAGGWIAELRWHCDRFALLVIGFRRGICYIPEPLASMRVLPGSYSASERRQWAAQREVLNPLLRLLKSPAYRDVLPLFACSGVMPHFGSEILRVVLCNPEHWDHRSLSLIWYPLRQEVKRLLSWRFLLHEVKRRLSPITPSPVKRAYRRVRDRRRQTSGAFESRPA